MQNLLNDLTLLLEQDNRLVAEGKLLKNKVVELALALDPGLIKQLLKHDAIKKHFFVEVEGVLVFDKIKFQRFVSNKQFLPDSYTAFKNKIGLTANGEYLTESKEVVLAWPYKDCVLEGGQDKEDAKRNEVFWNETLAPDQIDRLLSPKVLTGFKRYDKDGSHPVAELTLNDNLIIKGNNLLALHTLRKVYAGQVKLIYIDPPYNTGTDSFKYNDNFNHSTWLTFSGKTLMMTGLILYLYEQGFRNFLFFVNSTNIINKTRDNFLNAQSGKYLFAEGVSFGDKRVTVREVENFQAANQDDINIVFSTIQGLHMSLNTPRENSLTYDDFEDQKIVLISDEAHHINADTKKGQPTQDEMFEVMSWEGTVERIFRAHEDNVLLEFTATVDLTDENLAAKYKPKLIFDYPLKEFRKDGYSKEVKVLQADLHPFDRAMQAVLLSQYRRKIFEKNKLHIKPVILFKSRKISDSQAFFEEFRDGIQGLQASTLEAIRSMTTDATLEKMFAYFAAHNITMENLAIELKDDFSEDKLISVNSKEESEAKQLAVNSLEDESNAYRVVFAVDKLNEGWDVLNLFDIVRLYNPRDANAGNRIGKTTMSEAQLIGRGARYCPFQLSADQPLYGRKFDADLDSELRVCEELYYHSAYNPKYIQELNTALQELGIKAKETRERKIRLKENFKATSLYKAGHIFLNSQQKYDRADIDGLDGSLINLRHKVQLRTGYAKSTVAFEAGGVDKAGTERKAKDYDLLSFGIPIVRKATQRLEFYEFDNLKRHLPQLRSMAELITSERYLGQIKLEVSGLPEQIENLTPDEKLDAATQILDTIAGVIASDKVEFKGTKSFKPYMLKDKFTDKTLNFALDDNGDKEFGRSMNDAGETAYHLDLSKRDWYVFDDCFGTSEEKLLVQFIDKRHDNLKKKYSDAYLIRNEKHFKLYNFDDGRPLEPDFVLYLIGKEQQDTMHYQVFIEPKGSHLLKADEWKENFLISIKESFEIEQLFTNKKYAVWGLPFYNSESREAEFTEAFDTLVECVN